MNFEKVISERYSVRKFKEIPIESDVIDKILASGHKAPTGCNAQPQRILVINSPSSLEKLKVCTRCHFNAPAAMLVCYDEKESWVRPYDGALSAPVDAAIVATHMMLEAYTLGVGTCWVMHFDPVAMKKNFNIPDGVIPYALLMMGYPADDSEPLGMHYSKRDIEEVVFYDSF